MVTRKEILRSPEYWFEEIQNELYRQVVEFMEQENLNQTQLADRLGVSKGYISQLLKGEFNHSLKKLIELSLSMGRVPRIEYKAIAQVLEEDKQIRSIREGAVQTFYSNKSKKKIG